MARKNPDKQKPTPRKASSTRKVAPNIKKQKSAFRADTLIVVLLLAALIGFAFYISREKKNTNTETISTSAVTTFVFNDSDGIANSIEIKPAAEDAQPVKVARDAKNVWALELPIKTEADQGLAEAAASQISALQIVSTVPADADPAVFGFDASTFVISIGFVDGKTHSLEVGDVTPTNSGYYVRLDKTKIMIVNPNGIDSLTQLVSFPPYLNTPTPSALPPSETPVLPTDAVATPDLSVTPTP
jgi:hypothetical protein